jgi:hypothetical protein
MVSRRADRSNAVILDGLTIAQPLAIFIPDTPGISKIAFTMTDFFGQLALSSGETCAPWDLAKTATTACPAPRTSRAGVLEGFIPGAYTVAAEITMTDGTKVTRSATFTMSG